MSDNRRPQRSPIGAENKAPTAVPALSIATISETWLGYIPGLLSLSMKPVEKSFLKVSMTRIPLIALQKAVRVSVCLFPSHRLFNLFHIPSISGLSNLYDCLPSVVTE